MHKFYSPEEWRQFALESPEALKHVAASSGTGAGDWERLPLARTLQKLRLENTKVTQV